MSAPVIGSDPQPSASDSEVEPAESARRSRRLGGAVGPSLRDRSRLSMSAPGTAAGIEPEELQHLPGGVGKTTVTVIDYAADRVESVEVQDLESFFVEHRPAWSHVRWIDVDGLGQLDLVGRIAEKYQLHPLAIEDVVRTVERPKLEDFPASDDQPGRLFVVARAIDDRDGHIHSDQVSLFLGRTTLLTFHGSHREDLDPIRQRIGTTGSRLRQNDASFLLYALLDAIVDHYFPILERYSERLEVLEEEILEDPGKDTLQRIHRLKGELLFVRRSAWPMRDLIAELQREQHECLSDTAQTYLRDVHDHCIRIIDLVESYRETANGLAEAYVSVVSNRTNDIMKILTIIATIFIPLTFLAGVYGMNMPIPENDSSMAYPAFWLVCAIVAIAMIAWFRRRGFI